MDTLFLPVFLFTAIAFALALAMYSAGRLLGPRRAGAVKEMPYESGMDPIHDARRRFDVRFHLVAVAFLLFDVELLFLYPWAVASSHPAGIERKVLELQAITPDFSRALVFGEVLLFLALLGAGLLYIWRKGVLQWR